MMQFGQNQYSFVVASDVVNDGMTLEAWRHTKNAQDELVAEVFFSDIDGAMTFTAFKSDLPLELIEHLTEVARIRLTPTDKTSEEAAE